MARRRTAQRVCTVCGRMFAAGELVSAGALRPRIARTVAANVPAWAEDGWICRDDLNRFRRLHLEELVATEAGAISVLERQVIDAISGHATLASNLAAMADRELTLGERLADRIAAFGGSWVFISLFGVVLVVWMAANSFALGARTFDPYPYILLNLVLSCLAAIQAPVILMSQNRQEQRDRLRAEHDYQVNLKAELEIRQLHEKLDHLVQAQWQRLIEIQELQVEMIEDLGARRRGGTRAQDRDTA